MLKRPAAASGRTAPQKRPAAAVATALLKRPAAAAAAASLKRPAAAREEEEDGTQKTKLTKRRRVVSDASPGQRVSGNQLVLDHLVWVVPDLEEGMAEFEEHTGVRPVIGGKHRGLGTHNALVSLGDGAYLEILAKDPSQPEAQGATWLGVDGRGLTTVCARPASSELSLEAVGVAAEGTYDIGEIKDYSRLTPDGKTLEWRLAVSNHRRGLAHMPFDGLVPFLVDWSPNKLPHPSETAPGGCSLVSLEASHPNPEAAEATIQALGASGLYTGAVEEAPTPRIIASLMTPKGQVALEHC